MNERNGLPADDAADVPSDLPTDAAESMAQFFGNPKDVMDKYSHCTLCGANLHFSHVTDFYRNLTQETAKCPECGIKIRRVMHRLQ